MTETFDLSKEIAKRVTENKQDTKIFIVGEPGQGMSYAALTLSVEVAKKIRDLKR
jgi:ribose 5-phosphate isomerase RpiB